MRLAVVGGRDFKNYNFLKSYLNRVKTPITVIVSGEASGADTLAKKYAEEYGLGYDPYPADWSDLSYPDAVIKTRRDGTKYDAMAGHRRNQQIVDNADKVMAFWDYESSGTADSIKRTKKAGKPLIIINYITNKIETFNI